MQTLLAPGVSIREIDKSQYSPAMTGTNCLVMGFTEKGEPYTPMEFTSRAAWNQYYGQPRSEAERYSYAAVCEVLNQGGRLYFSRLPYDNAAFEKVVGFAYDLKQYHISAEFDDNRNPKKKEGSDDLDVSPFWEVLQADSSISDVCAIEPRKEPALYDLSAIDEYRTDEAKVANNSFLIVDTAFNTYGKITEDDRKDNKRELIGIMPVITTAANAMHAQSLITVAKESVIGYETIGKIKTLDARSLSSYDARLSALEANPVISSDMAKLVNTASWYEDVSCVAIRTIYDLAITNEMSSNQLIKDAISAALSDSTDDLILSSWDGSWQVEVSSTLSTAKYSVLKNYDYDAISGDEDLSAKYLDRFGWHNPGGDDSVPETVSQEANSFFPAIDFDGDHFDRTHLKKIGVVVYKMFLDPSEGNKINFEPVESFAGSLCKTDKDPNTGVTTFIDTIINSQSQYINFFSNCFNTPTDKTYYNETLDMFVAQPGICPGEHAKDCVTPSLGFYSAMTKEDISITKSIYDGMNKVFDKCADINERDIDIVPDAGLANIASYLKALFGDKGQYDLQVTDDAGNSLLGMWKCDSSNAAIKTWKTVEQKLDNFCKNTRKDCMFIADGPRPLVLAGQKKIVRSTKPENTIDANIIPNIKWVTGLNTSYGAMYVDWFEQADDYSGDFFWCPPSIKAMGVYINTDVNFNYWDAPAGLNRGVIAATDVAFSPTNAQAASFYQKNLNYAINYPQDGIVLEGQKTLQTKPSAFDRVNVRRLFLRLERAVYRISRLFIYETNTAYTRQRFVDAIDPYFKNCKVSGGITDYLIRCDESTNTDETIDRNELHVKIGIKPSRSIEFLYADFICTRTGMSFEEAMG